MGMSYEDFELPVIGICNTWNEIVPGQYNLRQVSDFVKKGILRAGGNPVEFGTIACCDGVTTGNDGDYYVLPSREIIADSVEVMAKAHKLDGIVLVGSCDKIVPGLLMGAARLNIPTIIFPAAPVFPVLPLERNSRVTAPASRRLWAWSRQVSSPMPSCRSWLG